MSLTTIVRAWTEDLILPTYLHVPPDKNPMFLEERAYQGSSGKVYPLPFTDRIAEKPVDRKWKSAHNSMLRSSRWRTRSGCFSSSRSRFCGESPSLLQSWSRSWSRRASAGLARKALATVLQRDPNHALAGDLFQESVPEF